MITINAQPNYIQALYNKLTFELTNSDYVLGTTHYCEVYTTGTRDIFLDPSLVVKNGNLITTLVKNGNGTGKCSFDVSGVLSSQLPDDQMVPNSTEAVQHDLDSYVGYYVRIGILSYNAQGQEVKTFHWESDVKWAFRGAFALGNNINYQDYYVRYVNHAKFLTNSPVNTEIRRDETTFLGTLIPLKTDTYGVESRAIHLMADFHFNDGTSLLDRKVNSTNHITGHVLLHNVRPDRMGLNPVQLRKLDRMEVWLDYEEVLAPVDTNPNWQFDTSTIRCEQNAPRTNSNRVALRLDVNPNSPTYSTYQGGPTNYQFYDVNAALCPIYVAPVVSYEWETTKLCATSSDAVGKARYYRLLKKEGNIVTAKWSLVASDSSAGYNIDYSDGGGFAFSAATVQGFDNFTYSAHVDGILDFAGVTGAEKNLLANAAQFNSADCSPSISIKVNIDRSNIFCTHGQNGTSYCSGQIYAYAVNAETNEPVTVQSLTINIRETIYNSNSNPVESVGTITATFTESNQALVYDGVTEDLYEPIDNSGGGYRYQVYHYLLDGTGYVAGNR